MEESRMTGEWPAKFLPRALHQEVKNDGFVKSPSAALHCILRRCGVLSSTPPQELCALLLELFTLPSRF
ncbi:MAG: hypothetical protein NTY64_12820 [Deltaproteobacteria bacterium]|nr:hypothetical protein [Deltaproteobacteria bacterium]